MGRSKSLLSGGEEKTCREGEKGKRRVDVSLLFSQAPGDFLIDFQGYVSNLFFRYGGLVNESASQCFSSNFPKFGPVWNVCSRSPWPPSPFHLLLLLSAALFLLFLSLKRKKEVTFTLKKACISRQDACADNIDPWLPLKNLLCLTDFSSFGLYMR